MVDLFGGSKLKIFCEQDKSTKQLICHAKKNEKIVAEVLLQVGPDGSFETVKEGGDIDALRELKKYAKENSVVRMPRTGEY